MTVIATDLFTQFPNDLTMDRIENIIRRIAARAGVVKLSNESVRQGLGKCSLHHRGHSRSGMWAKLSTIGRG